MRRLAWMLVLLLVAGCGGSTVRREAPVVVSGGARPVVPPDQRPGPRGSVRIVVVTHGQASSPFWAIVRNGVQAAARQADVLVSYRAPEIHSIPTMERFIGEAVESRPDGLVVSVPDAALGPAIRRAVAAGIPTITINSGRDVSRTLGVVAHVGQPEELAGRRAGERFARLGARRALCVNHDPDNRGLNARCRGLAEGIRKSGGSSRVLVIDDQDPATAGRIADAVEQFRIDAVLTLNALSAELATEGLQDVDDVVHGTFDLGPEILLALQRGRLAFAIDQQAYLQGYFPIIMLAQLARYGLVPGQGGLIPTGPNFVTREDAARVLDLSRRSIR